MLREDNIHAQEGIHRRLVGKGGLKFKGNYRGVT